MLVAVVLALVLALVLVMRVLFRVVVVVVGLVVVVVVVFVVVALPTTAPAVIPRLPFVVRVSLAAAAEVGRRQLAVGPRTDENEQESKDNAQRHKQQNGK